MELDIILNAIQKYYSEGTDNKQNEKEALRQKKIIEACREDELLQEISNITRGYSIINWTDHASCCYEYKILLHLNQDVLDDDMLLIEALGGVRYDLRIFISKLEPFYYRFIEKTEYIKAKQKWLFSTLDNSDYSIKCIIKELDILLHQLGYERLTEFEAKVLVPNVQTELLEISEANVFHCLFTDLVNI